MKRILMFDFDGVLVDSLVFFTGAFSKACRANGFDQVASRRKVLRLFNANFYEGMIEAGIPRHRHGAILRTMHGIMAEENGKYDFFPGIPAALARLARANHILIITSNLTGIVTDYLARHTVQCVAEVIGADKEPRKVVKIRNALAAHPGTTGYYIGDTLGDILEARAAGARTVAATWGWHTCANLRKAAPDYLVHSPAELIQLFASEDTPVNCA